MKILQKLYLDNNEIILLPKALAALKYLYKLDLAMNKLTCDSVLATGPFVHPCSCFVLIFVCPTVKQDTSCGSHDTKYFVNLWQGDFSLQYGTPNSPHQSVDRI